MKKIAFFLLILTLGFGQAKWQKRFEAPKVFTENIGQFHNNSKFGFDGWNEYYYFYDNSIVLELQKKEFEVEENPEEFWEKGKKELEVEKDFVKISFLNANKNAQVVPLKKENFYLIYSFNKGAEIVHSDKLTAYKKILYKNIYDNIDIIFSLPQKGGLKYEIILHPGANPSDIKISYNKPFKIKNNKIFISSEFGNIIDHSPTAYYKNKKQIPIKFIRKGSIISFEFLKKINKAKTIIIDPWIQTPALPNSNKVWEVETDLQGNVFAYGGDSNVRYLKYDNSGNLLWNYNTGWDSSQIWIGACVVEPTTGESYLTDGTGGTLVKLTPAGTVVFSTQGGGGLSLDSREYWGMSFNCDLTQLVNGGTLITIPFPPTPGSLFNPFGIIRTMDMNSGNIQNEYKVGFGSALTGVPTDPNNFPNPDIQEVSSICNSWTDKNTYYFLTIDSLGAFNTSTGNILFKISHNHNFYYYIPGYGLGTKQPVNLLRAGYSAFYLSVANQVEKRDLTSGNLINSAPIPGGVLASAFGGKNNPMNGGIDLDSCENVYVGSINQLVKYDKDLNQLNTYSTTFAIYDVDVSINGEVAVGGSNTNTSTAYVALINTNACNPMPYDCKFIVEILGPDTVCLGDTITYYSSIKNLTYQWSIISNNATIVGSTTNDSANVYFNTVDSVTIKLIVVDPLTNSTDTATKGVIVIPKGSSFSGPQQVCPNTIVNYSAADPSDVYQWQIVQGNATIQGQNNQQTVSVNTGTSSQFVIQLTTTNANKCTSTTLDTITVMPVADSILGPDGVCLNSTITYSAFNQSSGLTHTWSIESGTAQIQGSNSQQQVSVLFNSIGQVVLQLITSNGTCNDTNKITIDVYPDMTTNITGATDICIDNDGIFVLNSNVVPDSVSWNINPSANIIYQTTDSLLLQFTNTGQYTIEAIAITNAGCKDTATFTFQVHPALNLQLSGSNLACAGDTLTLSASANGNPTYQWQILQGNANIITNNNSSVDVEFPAADTIVIKITASSQCQDSILDTIIVVNNPTLQLIADTVCYGDTLWITATGQLPSGTIEWYYDNALTNPVVSNSTTFITGDSVGFFPATSNTTLYAIWKSNSTSCVSNVASITGIIDTLPNIDSVIVNPPVGEIMVLPDRTVNFVVNVSALPPSSYSNWQYIWDFGDGSSQQITTSGILSHQYPDQEGEYFVFIRVENAKNPECYDTIRVGQIIIRANYTLFIPNVFTPNSDGLNDEWFPVSNGLKEIKINIYDRWGNKIWTTNNLNNKWKGTNASGQALAEGVYVYVVEATFINNKKVKRTGTITLIR